MQQNPPSQTPKIIGAVVITAVVMGGAYLFMANKAPANSSQIPAGSTFAQTSGTSNTPAAAAPAPPASNSGNSSSNATVKDGTYTASANYMVPHGMNSISVTIDVKNGVIASVKARHSVDSGESQYYTSAFDQGISGAVVGKKLTSAQVSQLNGASDTSQGFDQALSSITQQAQA